jgi:tetratricopeptide (TPR) repeat protein
VEPSSAGSPYAWPSSGEQPTSALLVRGALCGRYTVVEPIGAGGWGVVYKAYDPELDRLVALKVLPLPEGAGEAERARLLREGQALARLDHPNVVAVHDVGVEEASIFLAMDLVRGSTIREWLKEPRSFREILDVFLQAGRGLAAAHAANVVHRDFKPDNALVGKDDRVRVVDFGLARTHDGVGHPAEPAPQGSVGAPSEEVRPSFMVGTPLYMSPEQLAGEPVSEHTDQFAFAVSLWSAVYGDAPFDGTDLLALLSNKRDGRLRTPQSAKNVPAWVRPILVRALAGDPKDRYPSMEALLEALARDRSTARRRWIVSLCAVGVVAAAVAAGRGMAAGAKAPLCPSAEARLAGVWDGPRRAAARAAFVATSKPYAARAYDGVERVLDAYAAAWVSMHDDACQATLVRGQQSSELLDLRMACLDDHLISLRTFAERLASADEQTVLHATEAAGNLPPLAECADLAALRAPLREPAAAEVRARIVAVRARIAALRGRRGTVKAALEVAESNDVVAEARDVGWPPLVAEALREQGEALVEQRDVKAAGAALHQAQLVAVGCMHRLVERQAWLAMADLYAYDGQSETARAAVEEAHACLDRDGNDDREVGMLSLDEAHMAQNDGDWDLATSLAQRSLDMNEKAFGPDHREVARSIAELGGIAYHKGEIDRSIELQRRALAIDEKIFGPDHPVLAGSLGNIANALSQAGRYDEALEIDQRILAIFTGAYGEDSRYVAQVLTNMGAHAVMAHDPKRALGLLLRARDVWIALGGPDDPALPYTYNNLAKVYLQQKRWEDAILAAKQSQRILEREKPDNPLLVRAFIAQGRALRGEGKPKEALAALERAVQIADTGKAAADASAEARFDLAQALVAAHADATRARALAAAARATYVTIGNAADVAAIDADFPPR